MQAIFLYFFITSLLLGLACFFDAYQNKSKANEFNTEGLMWSAFGMASLSLYLLL